MSGPSKLRICIVYDCLFPYTVGGAERWHRNLAERLAAEGHTVTYLTLRQWDEGVEPDVPGVEVIAVGPRCRLYGPDGNRRIGPPLLFGLGVLWRLMRRGRSYDVVHTGVFPYFSLLAAALLRPLMGYRMVVDWHEFWSKAYWRQYLGPFKGWIGWSVQALCARIPQQASCWAELTAGRIRAHGLNGPLVVLGGAYEGSLDPREPNPAEPLVVFAGRHIPEKRAGAVIPAVMRARERLPDLTASIFGSGPETAGMAAANQAIVEEFGSSPIVLQGHAPSQMVEDHLSKAMCMLLPSMREGYGLIVVEAAAKGTPSILVRGEDNAATELVEEGVNGFVAESASPGDLADAIMRVHEAGEPLRASTAEWFARNARRVSLGASLETILGVYQGRGPDRGQDHGSTL